MSDLKSIARAKLRNPSDFEKFFAQATIAIRKVRAEIELMRRAFAFVPVLPKTKPKTRACLRTNSDRKWAGHKANKPKHGWSKKRRARGGWAV